SDNLFKDRLIPFAVINPIYPGWRSDLKECIKMGIKGIRLFPQYHDYIVSDPSCIELAKMAQDHDLVIGLTIRMVDSRQRSWMDIQQVAGTENPEWNLRDFAPLIKAVPDAKYFILNLANGIQINEGEENI